MSIQQMLLGASGASGYLMDKSLRFRASASAYLNRTPATTSGNQTWTYSTWVKRGALGTFQCILGAGFSSTEFNELRFNSDDSFQFTFVTGGADFCQLKTSQVFRDPSAWYHIVVMLDTTQATASNRAKIYVNGVQVTAFSVGTYPSLNQNWYINQNYAHNIGRNPVTGDRYSDVYLAEINMVSGQNLTPASFGETNALTGVWQPKAYTGTYGTNGFYLDFEDTSSVAALGTDSSGNGNTWTVNNISLTAGVTYDSMTDVPTLTSATAANYAVLNPLAGNSNLVLSNGNLQGIGSGAGVWNRTGTMQIPSGKWYWETGLNGGSGSDCMFGIVYDPNDTSISTGVYTYQGASGNKYTNGVSTGYGLSYTNNDVIGIAFDSSAGSITFYKNGVSQGTAFTGITGSYFPFFRTVDTLNFFANFGQRPFAYTPPTGFVALNTFNLPTATILKGNTVMDATLYTGNGSTQTITNAGGFQPDLVWDKRRDSAGNNGLFDSVRGAGNWISSNATTAETSGVNGVSAFNSNGFSVGSHPDYNTSGATQVAWQWQAGQGSTNSNTSGTVTSTVSVNATAGFSICTLTTPASGTCTFGHGLGVAPSLVIAKYRSSTSDWITYHSRVGNTAYLLLNTTAASTTNANTWNNTSPTSSVVTLGSDFSGSRSIVAYCWSEIDGFSKFGSYTGNGSTDGAFVYTGFRPKFLLIKSSTSGAADSNWNIIDTSRNTYNVSASYLDANQSSAEGSYAGWDILSNGFKLRNTGTSVNASGQTYVFAAFAELPFKNSLAR